MTSSSQLDAQVKRCNEMARRLRFFHEQVMGAHVPLQSPMLDAGVDLDELEVCCSGEFTCDGAPACGAAELKYLIIIAVKA